MGYPHQNESMEFKIKSLTLGIPTLLLHTKRLWSKAVSNMLCPFSFKAAFQLKFSGVGFQFFPTYFHTWGFHAFVQEVPLQRVPARMPKWEPSVRTRIYLRHSPFHAGSVALILNNRTGNVSPQYHVVFDDTFSTVEHMRKGAVPGN